MYRDIRLLVELSTVKQYGKNPKQIEDEFKEEKRNYLKSVYAQYDSKYAQSRLFDPEKPNESGENTDADSDSFVSSLECGHIAIPRDLFPFLTIPRNVYVFMSQEQRDKLKYIPVVYNEETKECHINIKFKEVEKLIPYRIFKVCLCEATHSSVSSAAIRSDSSCTDCCCIPQTSFGLAKLSLWARGRIVCLVTRSFYTLTKIRL